MIDLPNWPAPAAASVAVLDFGPVLAPPLGGPLQKVQRLGSRSRLSVTMPPMRNGQVARQWLSRLRRAKIEGGRLPLPLLGFEPGVPGTVRVNGAAQAGSTLVVDGASAGYAFREDQPFSIVTGGVHHLHWVTAETVADPSGNATLPIFPMLRVQPADNDLCEFAEPKVEGFLGGDEVAWEMSLGNFIGFGFSIEEAE